MFSKFASKLSRNQVLVYRRLESRVHGPPGELYSLRVSTAVARPHSMRPSKDFSAFVDNIS